METIKQAIQHLNRSINEVDQMAPISFEAFLELLIARPSFIMRNVFQILHDMIRTYVGEGVDEYSNDPESIKFVKYDCSKLFVDGSDHPFFADRLFANRLINHVEDLKRGAQQNKIFIFEGPPGSGKSTFLNNLLTKFEAYANSEDGVRFENVWRLDPKILGGFIELGTRPIIEKLSALPQSTLPDTDKSQKKQDFSPLSHHSLFIHGQNNSQLNGDRIEISCPSHDNPILMVPKQYRRSFFTNLFKNDAEFKHRLFTEKEYEWVFNDTPCTICSSLYDALLNKLKDPLKAFEMLYARPYKFNRRLGEGISVFNPGDKTTRQTVLSNPMLQRRLNNLLKDSNQVSYIFSRYAKTNNGVYALMDIKSHNTDRLIELHNIISEGIHKVGDVEENVNSLFIALMNPEDKKNIHGIQSFSDRTEYIKIPYILDINTEVAIYQNIFGQGIKDRFLPRVLHNFARVIVSSRLNTKSDALLEWIGDPKKYSLYCDDNLQLLKMEIYTGHIPTWLTEEDRKSFTAKRRRKIISESEKEGHKGFSGRDSIKVFNEFYSTYAKEGKLIDMAMLCNFFKKCKKDPGNTIPDAFLDSLLQMYNYTILQEVKECLYYYNEEQISRDILTYLFAINFEKGTTTACHFTSEKVSINEDLFKTIEKCVLGTHVDYSKRLAFRKETQKEYTSKTLTQEMMVEGKDITQTRLYQDLYGRYVHNLKEKVLDPFLKNENFRRAIKDYDTDAFRTYDKKIQNDITFLTKNLCDKCGYTELGSKEVCIYVIDNDLAKKFSNP